MPYSVFESTSDIKSSVNSISTNNTFATVLTDKGNMLNHKEVNMKMFFN